MLLGYITDDGTGYENGTGSVRQAYCNVDYLTKLVSMSLIDHNYAVDQLIKYSYKKLKSEKRYTLRCPITIFVCPLMIYQIFFVYSHRNRKQPRAWHENYIL